MTKDCFDVEGEVANEHRVCTRGDVGSSAKDQKS